MIQLGCFRESLLFSRPSGQLLSFSNCRGNPSLSKIWLQDRYFIGKKFAEFQEQAQLSPAHLLYTHIFKIMACIPTVFTILGSGTIILSDSNGMQFVLSNQTGMLT